MFRPMFLVMFGIALLSPAGFDQLSAEEKKKAENSDLPEGSILRIGSSRFLAGGEIKALAFSPDGKLLASASGEYQNATIRIWDVETGKETKTLKGHKGSVSRLAFLPVTDAKAPLTLVSAGGDSTIRFWNINKGDELDQIINHPGPVADFAISPDGKRIASGSLTAKHIFLWDTANGKELRRWEAHQHGVIRVCFGPEGKTVASAGGAKNDFPDKGPRDDKALALWDATKGVLLKNFTGHDFQVTGIALSPDGKVFVAGGPYFRAGGPIWWDTDSGKQVKNANSGCYGIAVTTDGKTMAVADTSQIHFYDVETGAAQQPLNHKHQFFPQSMAYSNDGNTLATAGRDGRIILWDVRRRTVKGPAAGLTMPVRALTVSPDGKVIVTLGDDGVLLWDRAKGELLRKLDPGDEPRKTLAASARFLPDQRTLMLTHYWKEGMSLWDSTTGKHQRSIPLDDERARTMSVTADGALFVSGDSLADKIDIRDMRSGKSVRQFQAPKYMGRTDLRAAHLTPNGQYLLIIGFRYFAMHDVESGDIIYKKDKSGFGPTYAFSPGGLLMTEWSGTGKVALVETATGKLVAQVPGTDRGHCEGVLFSPDGRSLVVLQSGYRPGDASKVDLIEIASGKVLKSITAHRDKVRAAAFSPDGKALITGSDDCTVLVWDLTGVVEQEKKIDAKTCWDELALPDRRSAYLAFCRLRSVPDDAVAHLKKELAKPAADAELEKLRRTWAIRLLEDLNTKSAREVLQDLARDNPEAQAALKRSKRSDPQP